MRCSGKFEPGTFRAQIRGVTAVLTYYFQQWIVLNIMPLFCKEGTAHKISILQETQVCGTV
jgi:hypothetical protein